MNIPIEQKSSVNQIKVRFDKEVERFSNIETGQTSTVDAPLALDLVAQAASKSNNNIKKVLDIGCGAGNSTIKLAQQISHFDCDLIDLSFAMLEKALERISKFNLGKIRTFQGDFREIKLPKGKYDVIFASAVLHHLRNDQDWESTFRKIYSLTAPLGSVWITDLISHENEFVKSLMWSRYGEYLCSIGGKKYKEKVFDYIEKEDSPRPIIYQLDLLRHVGFKQVEILHKNSCFATFAAFKNKG